MNRLVARLSLVASCIALATFTAGSATAQVMKKKKLVPGDLAPALDNATNWVQGEKPDLSDGVVVVEFWATWCAPCKRAIPHLNAMHKAYQRHGLKVVGVAADESANNYEDNVAGVKSFVKSKGEGMSYIVAVDNLGDLKRKYMEASGMSGIPATFVVGRGGRVLWIGRPSSDKFDKVVVLAIRNKFDPVLTPKAWEALDAAKRAANLRNWREAYQQIDDAVKVDPPLFGELIVERYAMTLEQEKNAEAAKQYLKTILPAIANDPYSLELVVDAICKDPKISQRDLDSAMTYAEQMKRAVGSLPAPGFAAIALVHATKGDYDKAVEVQTSAWLASVPDDKAEYKRVLDEYQNIKTRKAQAKAIIE